MRGYSPLKKKKNTDCELKHFSVHFYQELQIDQKEASPFVIEWTPDILPITRVGELRIRFEFGHQQSGQSRCDKNNATMKSQNKLDSNHCKPSVALEIAPIIV